MRTPASAAFEPLPLGSVRPSGWLRDQLLAQARGGTGRLEQLWPDVGPSSGWLGGPGECWERGPYYLDGLVVLAEVLDDDDLRGTARKWIEWSLASQRDDGFFGPAHNLDWWPRMVMLNVLLSHHSATGDDRVPPFVEKYLRYAYLNLPGRPLEMWAAARGAEMVPAVLWCFERTQQPWLLDLAQLLVAQSLDWESLYRDFPYTSPAARLPLGRLLRAYLPARIAMEDVIRRWRPAKRTRIRTASQIKRSNESAVLRFYHGTHGVNHAMALRGIAYAASVTGGDPNRAARLADDTVQQSHGSAVGVVTADEHLAGRSPIHGIETCSVVETMRSCEELVRLTGNGRWADRLEQVAFNALPAALTDDLLGHQYYQQVTQVEVTRRRRPWFNGGADGTLFGLEPTYGCCTANLHQGWPRLAASAVLRSRADDGLALATLVPCTAVADIAGSRVRLEVTTLYPFDGQVCVRITVSDGQSVDFPLRIRVPGWVDGVSFDIDGAPVPADIVAGFATLARPWHDGTTVTMRLPMPLRQTRVPLGPQTSGDRERGGDQARGGDDARGRVIHRGPLVLCLTLPEEWTARRSRYEVPDWEIRTSSEWAFGLEEDALDRAQVTTHDVPTPPFDHGHPPVEVLVPARQLNGWTVARGSAGPVPKATTAGAAPTGRPATVRLVPYGSTALRVTVFPDSDR